MVKLPKKNINYDKYGYFFVAPYIIGFLVFLAYPIIYTFYLSFTNLKGFMIDYELVGLRNYIKLFQDEFFIKSFFNTWKLWLPNFVLQLSFALVLAAWFSNNRQKIRGASIFRTIFYLPNLITAASVALLFEALFSFPNGPVNQFLSQLGIMKRSVEFFMNPSFTSLLVSFIQTWIWYGQTLIILYASMIGISDSLYEAAEIDGASHSQMFFKITLPMLKPVMAYILTTTLVGGMQLFDVPFLITDGIGSPDGSIMTMTMYLYKHGFTGLNNYSYAAAVAVGQFFAILFCAIIVNRLLRDKDNVILKKGNK